MTESLVVKKTSERRKLLQLLAAAPLLSAVVHSVGVAQTFPSLRSDVAASLAALAERQNDDGSFGQDGELFGHDPAVAALCGLAFIANGVSFNDKRFGQQLFKLVQFLVSQSLVLNEQKDALIFSSPDQERSASAYFQGQDIKPQDLVGLIVDFRARGRKPLYGHGFATLLLCELFGTTDKLDLATPIRAAIDLIVRTQNQEGGWRYEPQQAQVADLSVTTCLLSSLRSARNAGFFVPDETVSHGLSYISSLQNSDGGFRYTSLEGPSGYGRTAAALHTLLTLGQDFDDAVEKGFKFLEANYPLEQASPSKSNIEYWTYAMFYSSLAYWRASRTELKNVQYEKFMQRVTNELLEKRQQDYLWGSHISIEAETALAICTLSVFQEGATFFLK